MRCLSVWMVLTLSALAAPPEVRLSPYEKVRRAIEANAGDGKHLYKLTYRFTKKELSHQVLSFYQEKKIRKLSTTLYDISPLLQSYGVPFHPGASALIDKNTGTITFINSGANMHLIEMLWRPFVPSAYGPA